MASASALFTGRLRSLFGTIAAGAARRDIRMFHSGCRMARFMAQVEAC